MDEPLSILRADLKLAARTMGLEEARSLVDSYYQMQERRKAAQNQRRAALDAKEPSLILRWLGSRMLEMEGDIHAVMDVYTDQHEMGRWAKSIYGIGPVLSAGLLAHIDITQAPTTGHIWRFAGLDPTITWDKGKKRPWNARLKVICWNVGQMFMRFHNRPECFYGQLYAQRKAYEIERNDSGGNAETAARILAGTKTWDKTKPAYQAYIKGRLPDGQIDARARRWAVKLFLAHYHEHAYRDHFGVEPPLPYAIAQLGHAHRIDAP